MSSKAFILFYEVFMSAQGISPTITLLSPPEISILSPLQPIVPQPMLYVYIEPFPVSQDANVAKVARAVFFNDEMLESQSAQSLQQMVDRTCYILKTIPTEHDPNFVKSEDDDSSEIVLAVPQTLLTEITALQVSHLAEGTSLLRKFKTELMTTVLFSNIYGKIKRYKALAEQSEKEYQLKCLKEKNERIAKAEKYAAEHPPTPSSVKGPPSKHKRKPSLTDSSSCCCTFM